ncbi:4,5-DOPA dioxygenase extradiol [Steroidobacter sp. S1-65]|uniref:4,5-DOPA dioxygenase extradiol n=1 Tax=Steroidobacter gossypii TaxID=2805490 RepID=A0ABS1WTK1_9GAMM|nr:4,5-DOPA dioxygenase extradiol [Steroidobacter gossypii]MBM0104294.1 4,5-DOPA dioxygenase extradiol [Steroidobacter gossypii]
MSAFQRLPAIFFGHGNPMNALADNVYTRGWRQIGASIPKPRAVLCISAHWYVPYTGVTAMPSPPTIHDFGGFPRELFEVQYAAPGSAEIAAEIRDVIGPSVRLDESWGLDHGTWSVLCHVYPDHDVPVLQLSIDEILPARAHYRIGGQLAALREQGILLIGSGNLVHNLHAYGWGRRVIEPYDWAVRFEQQAREWMLAGNHQPLIDYESLGQDAALAAPTPDHYLPLLYVLGAQLPGDEVTFPVEGVDGGSISMLTVQLG